MLFQKGRTLFLCVVAVLIGAFAVRAQNDAPKSAAASYQIVVQLLAASDSQNAKLPANLALVERNLKDSFGRTNYAVAMTIFNRAAENGILEVKGITPFAESPNALLNFYEMSLFGLKPSQTEMQIDSLRFGLRIPIVTNALAEAKGTYNYEYVGITAKPLSVIFNEPTIIGTLTTSRSNEQLFLVLTVKPENKQLSKK
jgi:hypothetical protein